jgi:carbon starvation protein
LSDDARVSFLAGAAKLEAELLAGTLPAAKAAVAPQLIFNQRLDAVLMSVFVVLLWIVIADMLRVAWRVRRGLPVRPSSETPHERRAGTAA